MPWIIGTAGHIDHGKTSLIKALTGQDTDRLKEEKERASARKASPMQTGDREPLSVNRHFWFADGLVLMRIYNEDSNWKFQ